MCVCVQYSFMHSALPGIQSREVLPCSVAINQPPTLQPRPGGIREAIECASIIVWALSRSELLNVELLLNNHR